MLAKFRFNAKECVGHGNCAGLQCEVTESRKTGSARDDVALCVCACVRACVFFCFVFSEAVFEKCFCE